MIRVLGRSTSSNVMKVMWTAAEIGLPVERIDIGGPFGGNDRPDYLALNPNGLVPTVEDGPVVLWESNAIVRYLAAKYDPDGLAPTEPGARARLDRWMDWQQTTLGPAFTPIFLGLVRTPPEQRDHAMLETQRQLSATRLAILDRELADRPFLGGDRLTIADIPLGAIVHRWFTLPLERPDMPHLAAYYDRLRERPGYVTHIVDIPTA